MLLQGDLIPKNSRADESVLHKATPTGHSLRTTIPSFIISSLSLKKGDLFRWEIKEVDGERYLKVKCFISIEK